MRQHRFLVLTFLFSALQASAQLPDSGTVPDSDWPMVRAEIARVEKVLESAPDHIAATYEVARTWALAKQWSEAMQWLRKVADTKGGIDPSRDSLFAELRGTREFEGALAAVREATPPVSHSTSAFTVAEGDLVPESVAYDPKSKNFYFGSMRKGKVLRCAESGECAQFAAGLGVVLGLKVNGNALWLLNNSERKSELIHYDLASGQAVRRYAIAGAGHNFNDLAFSPAGDIYLTDTPAGAVWHLTNANADLVRMAGRFQNANGIALSPDASVLYVSTFPDGITVVDLKTLAASPVTRPAALCLATIDGLYFYHGGLIAIQNGFMSPRVVRLMLNRDLHAIDRFEVLERRNPLFEGVTTGVLAGGDFFYMANIQDDKNTGFIPITILRLHL